MDSRLKTLREFMNSNLTTILSSVKSLKFVNTTNLETRSENLVRRQKCLRMSQRLAFQKLAFQDQCKVPNRQNTCQRS